MAAEKKLHGIVCWASCNGLLNFCSCQYPQWASQLNRQHSTIQVMQKNTRKHTFSPPPFPYWKNERPFELPVFWKKRNREFPVRSWRRQRLNDSWLEENIWLHTALCSSPSPPLHLLWQYSLIFNYGLACTVAHGTRKICVKLWMGVAVCSKLNQKNRNQECMDQDNDHKIAWGLIFQRQNEAEN